MTGVALLIICEFLSWKPIEAGISMFMLESYRNEQELFNLQCWALTCESFFDTAEWIWIYKRFGYSGDYEFIYFE